jgi:SAM-dependent methyltransferase
MAQRASSQNAYIKRHLSDNHALKNVLDIGAGAGKLIETFLPGSAIFAVESDQTMTTHLNMHPSICVVPESRIFENNHVGKFDLITMSHVFEHINNPIEYLYQLHKILVYNGHLFLEVPNEPEPVIRHHIKRKKKGVGHLFDYTIDTLKLMIAKSGLFDIVDIASYGVSVFDWMDGAKLNNFQENHEGDGVYIRCMLKRREVDNAYIESGYMDAVLQSRYANQFLLESKIEALHYEMSQKDQRIRRLSMALERIEGSLGSHLAGNN